MGIGLSWVPTQALALMGLESQAFEMARINVERSLPTLRLLGKMGTGVPPGLVLADLRLT